MEDGSLIGSICSKTGISKRSIGGLTGTHHSMVVRYSAGTHSLPVKALPALLKLYTEVKDLGEPAPPLPSPADIAALQEQAAWCLTRCYPLRKKLAAMQKLYSQGATTLHLLATQYSTAENSPKMQRWKDQQFYEANNKMEQNNWAAQFKISTAIALLEQEAGICNAVISESLSRKVDEA
jgi:hypothetical protein